MQFRDLGRQYQAMKEEMDRSIAQALMEAHSIGGWQVRELERRLAEFTGRKHCVTCGNGTDALLLALMAWGIGPGDAIFVPDFTFFATAEVVSRIGATPVFVDVDADTFNLSALDLERKIEAVRKHGNLAPKAVITVDLYGLPANYPEIITVAEKYRLKVLEDAAQGFGGSVKGKRACDFGDMSTTSFFPAKPLGCYGDGGAIFTDQEEEAVLLRSLCVHGKGMDKYDNVRIGTNSRLDTIQAAVLLTKLEHFQEELTWINETACRYTERLSGKVKIPETPEGFFSSWAQYTIQLPDQKTRDRLKDALKAAGIPAMVYYPKPLHLQEAFSGIRELEASCPVSESLSERVLSLPIGPYMSPDETDRVCSAVLNTIL